MYPPPTVHLTSDDVMRNEMKKNAHTSAFSTSGRMTEFREGKFGDTATSAYSSSTSIAECECVRGKEGNGRYKRPFLTFSTTSPHHTPSRRHDGSHLLLNVDFREHVTWVRGVVSSEPTPS